MQIVEAQDAVQAESLVVLGAQGARLNREGMRSLSRDGIARSSIAATIIAEHPDTEGILMLMGGYGEYSGGGEAPTRVEQTEAATHKSAIQQMVIAGEDVNQGRWKVLTGYQGREGTDVPITERFAGSTVSEVKLILDAIRALKAEGKQAVDAPTYLIAGRKHLDRVSDILDALNDPLADSLIGVLNHDEREGVGATVTREIYRNLVIRGSNNSVSAEELVRREKATVGKIFTAKNAVMGLKSRLGLRKSQTGRHRAA